MWYKNSFLVIILWEFDLDEVFNASELHWDGAAFNMHWSYSTRRIGNSAHDSTAKGKTGVLHIKSIATDSTVLVFKYI